MSFAAAIRRKELLKWYEYYYQRELACHHKFGSSFTRSLRFLIRLRGSRASLDRRHQSNGG